VRFRLDASGEKAGWYSFGVALRVQKYGGSSVASVERVRQVAQQVAACRRAGDALVVVVSAMGDTTDELLGLARRVSADPPRRELDMLLSAGERISMALLSMALQELAVEAISFTGSQSGILTDGAHANARILEVRPARIQEQLALGKVVIVAGYQGVSAAREVTTLGRGGSDTTAVALAAALGAECCEIFSDVDGVFSADPRLVPEARRLEQLTYEEMGELARSGARVLNAEAVAWAERQGIVLHARHASGEGQGTRVQKTEAPRAGGRAVGIALRTGVASLHWRGQASLPALCEALVGEGAELQETIIAEGSIAIWLPLENLHGFAALRPKLESSFPGLAIHEDRCVVTAVGAGIGANPASLRAALAALQKADAPIHALVAGPARLSLLTDSPHGEAALRHLHGALIEG
jgi:aspartate kinase